LNLPNLTMVQYPHAYCRNPCHTHCAKSWKPLCCGTCQAQAFVPIHAHSCPFWVLVPIWKFWLTLPGSRKFLMGTMACSLILPLFSPLTKRWHKGESSWVYLTSLGATWLLRKSMKTIMEWNVLGGGHCAPCATRLTQIPHRHTPSPYYIWLHECLGAKISNHFSLIKPKDRHIKWKVCRGEIRIDSSHTLWSL
jgi:hypothetical protein